MEVCYCLGRSGCKIKEIESKSSSTVKASNYNS